MMTSDTPYTLVEWFTGIPAQSAEAEKLYGTIHDAAVREARIQFANAQSPEAKSTADHRIKVLQTGSAEDSGLPFEAIPRKLTTAFQTCSTRFSNPQMGELYRRRLGIEAEYTDHLKNICPCESLNPRHQWNNVYHADGCKKFAAHQLSHRRTQDAIMDFIRNKAGLTVTKEPYTNPAVTRRKGDLMVYKGGTRVFLDVTSVAVFMQSHSAMAKSQPLACARHRERHKHNKYDADMVALGADASLVPIVIETSGGIGGEAQAFLKSLSTPISTYLGVSAHEASKIIRYFKTQLACIHRKSYFAKSHAYWEAMVPRVDVSCVFDAMTEC